MSSSTSRPRRVRRAVLIVFVGVAALALSVATLLPEAAQPAAPVAAATTTARLRASASTAPALPPTAGATIDRYQLELESHGRVDLGALSEGGTTTGTLVTELGVTIAGTLERLELGRDDDGSVELLRVADATATFRNNLDPASAARHGAVIAEALGAGIVVHRDPHGA